MSDLNDLRHKIDGQFQKSFGRTPLDERVVDILTQATSLGRFIDLNHLRDEAGDLLCSALQLCTECGWNPEDLAANTLAKITSRQDIYNRLGRKLRVALLGGAFDPIHRGHIEAAQAVLQFGGVDEVWLMPCYEHLAGKAMAAPEHRLEMCRVAVRSLRAIGIFDYELRHRFRGETYHLIKSLLAEEVAKLRCDFHLVIGQDNAEGFSTWTNGEALERMIPFIVVPRPGCASPKLNAWYLRAPHRFLADAPSREAVSSTEVRRRLHDRDATVEDLLPEGVWQYIRTQGLYQPEPATVPSALPARKTAIFVSTFDPPSIGYRTAVERLLETGFNQVVFCPAFSFGMAPQQEHAATTHRAALADLSVRGLPSVVVDLSELERRHSPGFGRIETRYEQDAEVWHVVDVDQVSGGRAGRSIIQTCWEGGPERWQRCRFVVLHAPADPPAPADLPPQCQLLPIEQYVASAALRNRIYAGDTIHGWLMPEVANYVKRHRLFRSFVPGQSTRLQILQPRLLIEFDARNPNAAAIAERYQKYAGEPPNVILVIGGDGTMLHAIRRHWRLRVPFLGLNAGHLGFLANERLPDDLDKLNFVAYSLPMLRVASRTLDGRTTDSLAFSDAWLERDGGQAAWLRLDIDGQTRVRKIVGDGMLLATAAGSSAYARALGASPLPLNTPVLTLAGSNVFQPRFWKPMTLAEDSEVSLISLDRSGKRPVRGFVDGQPLGVIESLSLARSAVANVELAFVGEFDPTAKLLRSLFPPTEEA